MHKITNDILKHRKSYFSQNGEDGFLEYVLSKIPEKTGWCVEFGAYDGKDASNTYYFISKQNYKSVMIEADPIKYKLLCDNMNTYNTICINTYVRPEGDNKLDNILSTTNIPISFDLLSIDVDGDDYRIWQSLCNYQPKVVIIEINNYFKPGIKYVNKLKSLMSQENISCSSIAISEYTGTSISSMTDLAISKNYSLIANINCNAIYVKRKYLNLFYDNEVEPNEVFTYEAHSISELTLKEMRHLGLKRLINKLINISR